VRASSARYAQAELTVDEVGRIEPGSVPPRAVLVHCQLANHEVGTMQEVNAIAERAHAAGALVHVDAAMAVGHVPIDFRGLTADLLSLSGHKFGGPPGVGALLIRRGLRIEPMLVGGDQERARRAGLENVASIAGLGAAAVAVAGTLEAERTQALDQTQRLLNALTAVEGVTAFGDTSPGGRVPQMVCVGVAGVEAEAVLLGLDQAGIAAHSGSACSSESIEPSPVLEAMGVDSRQSLRLSVGWNTTDEDIKAVAAAFPNVVDRLRALAS
jgi:cysteine desulfurase